MTPVLPQQKRNHDTNNTNGRQIVAAISCLQIGFRSHQKRLRWPVKSDVGILKTRCLFQWSDWNINGCFWFSLIGGIYCQLGDYIRLQCHCTFFLHTSTECSQSVLLIITYHLLREPETTIEDMEPPTSLAWKNGVHSGYSAPYTYNC